MNVGVRKAESASRSKANLNSNAQYKSKRKRLIIRIIQMINVIIFVDGMS